MTISQTISDFPTPKPNRNDDSSLEFAEHADKHVTHLVDEFVPEINVWKGQCNSTKDDINADKEAAATSATASAASASEADTYKDEAQASQNATKYSGATLYNIPDTVIGSDGHTYRCIVDATSGDDPIGSTTGHWKQITVDSDTIDEAVQIIEIQNFAFSIM